MFQMARFLLFDWIIFHYIYTTFSLPIHPSVDILIFITRSVYSWLHVLENLELSLMFLFATNQLLHSRNCTRQCLLCFPTIPFNWQSSVFVLLLRFGSLKVYAIGLLTWNINTLLMSLPPIYPLIYPMLCFWINIPIMPCSHAFSGFALPLE